MGQNFDEISEETQFWLSQPNILESVAEAAADFAESRALTEQQVRLRFNVPVDDCHQDA